MHGRLTEKNEKSLKMDGCWRSEVKRVVFRESGTTVEMGIWWRDGLDVFNTGEESKLPKKVVHKGRVGLSMREWKKNCSGISEKKEKMNEFTKLWNTTWNCSDLDLEDMMQGCYWVTRITYQAKNIGLRMKN